MSATTTPGRTRPGDLDLDLDTARDRFPAGTRARVVADSMHHVSPTAQPGHPVTVEKVKLWSLDPAHGVVVRARTAGGASYLFRPTDLAPEPATGTPPGPETPVRLPRDTPTEAALAALRDRLLTAPTPRPETRP